MVDLDQDEWGSLVARRFPPRDPATADAEWEAVKRRLVIGQSVHDEVIARAPFGAWIDIGVGFPAELDIILIEGLTPERYQAGDWCPIGSEITAFVGGFQDHREMRHGRQIRLWQVQPGWWRDASR